MRKLLLSTLVIFTFGEENFNLLNEPKAPTYVSDDYSNKPFFGDIYIPFINEPKYPSYPSTNEPEI